MFHSKTDIQKSDENKKNIDKIKEKQSTGKFQLLNADGTPLNLNISDSDSDEITKVPVSETLNLEVEEPNSKKIISEENNFIPIINEKEEIINSKQIHIKKEDCFKDSSNIENDIVKNTVNNNLSKNTFDDMVCEKIINDVDDKLLSELIFKDSEELNEISDFMKYIQLEKLLRAYPPITFSYVNTIIQKILYSRERKNVEFSLILKSNRDSSINAKIKALKEKKDNTIEKVRNELNRVTETNVQDVISVLSSLKVEKINEMKEIAVCFFEKCIKETVYQNVYILILATLKKTWRCIEETQFTDKAQTCFFGYILTLLMKQLTTPQNWAKSIEYPPEIDPQQLSQFIDDAEADRLKLKRQYLGAINLIVNLYTSNVIGPNNIIIVIEHLICDASPENIESLNIVASELSYKFVQNDKQHIVKKIEKFLLANKSNVSLRLKFMIEKVLDVISSAFSYITSENTSVFASMCDEEFNCTQPSSKSASEIANEYILKISSELSVDSNKNDNDALLSQVTKYLANCDNDSFFLAFFIETITNLRKFDSFRVLFLISLKTIIKNISKVLTELKSELSMLELDFPCTSQKYAELLCYLRADNLITQSTFKSLQNNNFNKLTEHLSIELRTFKD